VIQNPSDPDATYDGHKGPGYQVQIAETCDPENEVQLITCALPQTAVESDTTATGEVLDSLEESEFLPQEMFADTHYCSDENIQDAAQRGVELVGPVQCGSLIDKDVDHLNVDDFDIDEETEEVACCPAGHKPASSIHDKQTGKTKTVMSSSTCSQCKFRKECPVEKCGDGYCLCHTAKGYQCFSRALSNSWRDRRNQQRTQTKNRLGPTASTRQTASIPFDLIENCWLEYPASIGLRKNA